MVEIKEIDEGFRGLFASVDIGAGNVILLLSGNYFNEPTRTSIQIGSRHLEHYEGGYINHHCEPSAEIVVHQNQTDAVVVAKKDIKEGEEITFDYETTEEILAEPFSCQCHGRLIEGWNAIKIHQRRKSFMMG